MGRTSYTAGTVGFLNSLRLGFQRASHSPPSINSPNSQKLYRRDFHAVTVTGPCSFNARDDWALRKNSGALIENPWQGGPPTSTSSSPFSILRDARISAGLTSSISRHSAQVLGWLCLNVSMASGMMSFAYRHLNPACRNPSVIPPAPQNRSIVVGGFSGAFDRRVWCPLGKDQFERCLRPHRRPRFCRLLSRRGSSFPGAHLNSHYSWIDGHDRPIFQVSSLLKNSPNSGERISKKTYSACRTGRSLADRESRRGGATDGWRGNCRSPRSPSSRPA